MKCPHCGLETILKLYDYAEYRKRKAENIKRSFEKAKKNGTHIGRLRIFDYERVRALRQQGLTFSEIAAKLKVSIGLVQRALK